jgi:CRP-like cAMP-binding protein
MSPRNLLLDRLPRDVFERIKSDLKRVFLSHGQILHRAGEEIRYLHFPLTCMVSITVMTADGRTIETGAIGNRGVAGINAFMGGHETTQTEYICQVSGDNFTISAEPLKIEFNRNTELREVLLKYTQVHMAEISQNVACISLHTLEQRFARWLLEVRERTQTDRFTLTQEFMAQMLGVRRAGVTVAALAFKEMGAVEYARGDLVISDVQALRKVSCECYQTLKDEYDRLLGVRGVGSLG